MRRVLSILGLTSSDGGTKPLDEVRLPSRWHGTLLTVGAIVLAAVLGAVVASAFFGEEPIGGAAEEIVAPAEDSAEVGFARDMIVHHAQAVQMSEIVRDKTESQEIRTMVTDIALTQQAQIGQMQGWLAVWGLPLTSPEPAMGWMGHPTEGRMPGMASAEELNALQKASGEEADVLFLQLMIPHHEAAVPMAEAVLEETEREEVKHLAGAIAASQQGEIELMQSLLKQRGAPAESSPTPIESHSAEEKPHRDSHLEQDHESHTGSSDDSHPAREATLNSQETASGIARGATQGAAAFLVGLVAFVVLVWIPTSRAVGLDQYDTGLFVRCVWLLFGLLVIASVAEISLYAVRASGQSLSLGLLGQTLLDTRVGTIWLVRLVSGLLTVVAATLAVWLRQPAYWWWAAGTGAALLETLTLTSHAAAEGFLPSLADWLHMVAASLWMGGLLGLALVLLGPPRAMPIQPRKKFRWRAVRRFSKVAILAVVTIIFTGVYASLLHVPDVDRLLGTPYGRVLLVKLGLAVLLLSVGAMNLALDGREPFGRLVAVELALAVGIFVVTGFLTSLPPANSILP